MCGVKGMVVVDDRIENKIEIPESCLKFGMYKVLCC